MKKLRFLLFTATIATVLLSACGAVAATPSARDVAPKVDAVPVAFIGVIDSMAGDQWVINGNTLTVSPDVVRNGPFNVGDQVKVEGAVSPDGSFGVSRVEPPTAADLSSLPPLGGVDNPNSNTNDSNVNDANINNANVNAVNSNDDNSNAANANDSNVNDNSNDANSNDDNSNAANVNDGNGNDDNGTNENSNDDNGSGSNSNDDHGGDNSGKGDDNSGKGGGDDDGNDD